MAECKVKNKEMFYSPLEKEVAVSYGSRCAYREKDVIESRKAICLML